VIRKAASPEIARRTDPFSALDHRTSTVSDRRDRSQMILLKYQRLFECTPTALRVRTPVPRLPLETYCIDWSGRSRQLEQTPGVQGRSARVLLVNSGPGGVVEKICEWFPAMVWAEWKLAVRELPQTRMVVHSTVAIVRRSVPDHCRLHSLPVDRSNCHPRAVRCCRSR